MAFTPRDWQEGQDFDAPDVIDLETRVSDYTDTSMETQFRVQQFGILPDGNDHSGEWADMVTEIAASGASGARIVFPAGQFILSNVSIGPTVTLGHVIIEGQGTSTQLIPGAGQGRVLTVVGSGGSRPVTIRNLHLGWTPLAPSPSDLPYNEPMIELHQCLYYNIDRVTGYHIKQGTLIYLNDSYNGSMSRCYLYCGDYAIAILLDTAAIPGGDQIDSIRFDCVSTQGSFGYVCNGSHTPTSIMTLSWDSCKIVTASSIQAKTYAEGLLNTASLAGDTSQTLGSGQGALFTVGDAVFMGRGSRADFEVAKIDSITTDTLHYDQPLLYDHDPGVATCPVVRGGCGVVLPGTAVAAFRSTHFEGFDTGVQAGGINGVHFESCTFSCARAIRAASGTQGIRFMQTECQGIVWVDSTIMNFLVDIPSWNTSIDQVLASLSIMGPLYTKTNPPQIIAGSAGALALTYFMAAPWSVEIDATPGSAIIIPPGTYEFEGVGGGSGGAAGGIATAVTSQVGGGGGGGGAWVSRTLVLTATESVTFTVGAGGTGGTTGNGGAGADSTASLAVASQIITAPGSKLGGTVGGANSTATVPGGLYGSASVAPATALASVGEGGFAANTMGAPGVCGVGKSGGGGAGGAQATATHGGVGGPAGGSGIGGASVNTQTGTTSGANGAAAPANTGGGGGGGGGAASGGTAGQGGAGGSGRWHLTRLQ